MRETDVLRPLYQTLGSVSSASTASPVHLSLWTATLRRQWVVRYWLTNGWCAIWSACGTTEPLYDVDTVWGSYGGQVSQPHKRIDTRIALECYFGRHCMVVVEKKAMWVTTKGSRCKFNMLLDCAVESQSLAEVFLNFIKLITTDCDVWMNTRCWLRGLEQDFCFPGFDHQPSTLIRVSQPVC